MDLITWNTHFSIGIDDIDDHHRHLMALLNAVYDDFIQQKAGLELAKVFAELTAYSQYHFSTEEAVMREHGYPGYALHKIRHDQFVERLKSLQESVANGRRQVSFELLTFLNTWLLSHILVADADIGRFLAVEGLIAA